MSLTTKSDKKRTINSSDIALAHGIDNPMDNKRFFFEAKPLGLAQTVFNMIQAYNLRFC